MQLSHSIHCTAVGQSLVRRSRNIIGLIVALLLAFALPATAQQQKTVTFTSSGTFTVPPGVTSITVRCWGGGGRGGSYSSGDGIFGGGGGGAFAQKTITVSELSTLAINVGGGGVSNSTNGGKSWVYMNSDTIVAANQ